MISKVAHFLATCLLTFNCATVPAADQGSLLEDVPWIVAHRGASGSLPEHTLEAYSLAVEQGADFIECDVVLTKDCQPICRHEPDISHTTDALMKFPTQQKNRTIDGVAHLGVFAIDLTLEEIRSLRALQPRPYREQRHNGMYSIPTLQEYIRLAQSYSRAVGIYPETKHAMWHDSQGLSCMQGSNMTAMLLQILQQHGYGAAIDTKEWRRRPAFIQSFEVDNLKWLSKHTAIPLLQLLEDAHLRTADTNQSYGELMSDAGLAAISEYASGIGPWKGVMVPADGTEPPMSGWRLGARAHAVGLLVHPYTFRDDAAMLPHRWHGQPELEYQHFLDDEGVDGAFTDFPATLAAVLKQRRQSSRQATLSAMTAAHVELAMRQSQAEI